jgi:hypothetical protein
MRKYFVVSRWWDRTMGWWLWLRRRPRCARTPFEPAAQPRSAAERDAQADGKL